MSSTIEQIFKQVSRGKAYATVTDFANYLKNKDENKNGRLDLGANLNDKNGELQKAGASLGGIDLRYMIKQKPTKDGYDGCSASELGVEIVARAAAGTGKTAGNKAARLKGIKDGITLQQFIALTKKYEGDHHAKRKAPHGKPHGSLSQTDDDEDDNPYYIERRTWVA